MKLILIPVSNRPESALNLHHGFNLAKRLNSNVVGCHIRAHSDTEVNLPSESHEAMVSLDSYDLAWEAALKDKQGDDTSVEAHNLFNKMAEQFEFDCSKKINPGCKNAMWSERVGSPEKIFRIIGPTSDLMIVSRPEKKASSKAKTIMIGALMNSSSPVLILPQKKITSLGKNISIAWNQSRESMLAVKAALPLLVGADKINIIACGPENNLGPKSKQLQQYLSCWNLSAECLTLKSKGNDIETVLEGYQQSQSDLLIMGAYSRSRLSQQIFGGFTEYMLNEVDIPVFMLHT